MKYKIKTVKTISWDAGSDVPVSEAIKFFKELICELESIKLTFEIAPKGLEVSLSWELAQEYCSELGEGWRLPSEEELNLMYLSKTDDMRYKKDWYWSSTELCRIYSKAQYFHDGCRFHLGKNHSHYVRPVRDL